ncbi:hypothetical protein VNO80_22088 [Phaseolus coccineus]|uniref:Uncharacterized protein n=1 Tax=Phaseolus coccineus TaxID=3886 RepID=A0AAN9QTY3_PHACN
MRRIFDEPARSHLGGCTLYDGAAVGLAGAGFSPLVLCMSLTGRPLMKSEKDYFKTVSKILPFGLIYSPNYKHVYPDPIPEFADSKLSVDEDEFGDDLDAIVAACTQHKKKVPQSHRTRTFSATFSPFISLQHLHSEKIQIQIKFI